MKQSKAVVSFDLLFAALPLLLMISYLATVIVFATETADSALQSNELTGKLSTIADYLVKRGAVERREQENEYVGTAAYRPNVIDGHYLEQFEHEREEIQNWMDLKSLEVSWGPGKGTCIYRLVLYNNEVKKLYVCGESNENN